MAFGGDTEALTAVPDGATAPVTLFDMGLNTVGSGIGTTPQTLNGDAVVDPAGAAYLNSALHTTFFTAGQAVGSLAVSYTPAS